MATAVRNSERRRAHTTEQTRAMTSDDLSACDRAQGFTMALPCNACRREEAIRTLRDLLPPGARVYTVLLSVSRSGMSRTIATLLPTTRTDGKDNEYPHIRNVSGLVAQATEYRLDKRNAAVVIGGAGMDMGFAIVYDLAQVLYPQGFACIGAGCPANDHANAPYPRARRGGMQHKSGGYAIRHEWAA